MIASQKPLLVEDTLTGNVMNTYVAIPQLKGLKDTPFLKPVVAIIDSEYYSSTNIVYTVKNLVARACIDN